MTWKPASVEKKPGHVKVGWNSISTTTGRFYIHLAPFTSIHYAVVVKRIRKNFFLMKAIVYYVNGVGAVYETNILYPSASFGHITHFDPVGRRADNTPVLFRKLHKLEWLFT